MVEFLDKLSKVLENVDSSKKGQFKRGAKFLLKNASRLNDDEPFSLSTSIVGVKSRDVPNKE